MKATTRLACFSLLAFSAAAHGQASNECPAIAILGSDCIEITGLPYTASTPGVHCLKGSLSGSGSVIIAADNVTIELNGHTLDTTALAGVLSNSGRRNTTVRNGTLRAGDHAILISVNGLGTSGNLVELIRAERSSIDVAGSGSVVRNNIVVGTAPVTGIRYGFHIMDGTGIRVSNNVVVNPGEGHTGEVGGYRVLNTVGAVIENNVVSRTELSGFGITIWGSSGTVVAGNRITNMRFGILNNTPGPALFVDNTVFGATLGAFTGGTLVGTTNVSF